MVGWRRQAARSVERLRVGCQFCTVQMIVGQAIVAAAAAAAILSCRVAVCLVDRTAAEQCFPPNNQRVEHGTSASLSSPVRDMGRHAWSMNSCPGARWSRLAGHPPTLFFQLKETKPLPALSQRPKVVAAAYARPAHGKAALNRKPSSIHSSVKKEETATYYIAKHAFRFLHADAVQVCSAL